MDIAARITLVECIYAPALASAVSAGWYDYVEQELERNIEFVQEFCSRLLQSVYEDAKKWVASIEVRSVDRRGLLNVDHPAIKNDPRFYEAYALLERIPRQMSGQPVGIR